MLVRWLTRLSLALCVAGSATSARADSLQVDLQSNPDRNFQAVQELSYEAIIAGSDGYHADLRLRVALHNASNREQDAVLSLALPRESQIHGLQVARDGAWLPGKAAGIAPEPGRREPGSVYARLLAPTSAGDPPAAELVVFSLEPNSTTQIELQLSTPTRLRGDRWELELPGRGQERTGLSPERRVLVHAQSPAKPARAASPASAPRFWVDANPSAGAPFMLTQPDERIVVSWPMGHVQKASTRPLDARLEVMPDDDADRRSGGRFRLYLRMNPVAAAKPDHVVVVLDRSRSTDPRMHREAFAAITSLFDSLPSGLTFDAISFARQARPLLPDGAFPGVHDKAARDEVAALLDAGSREQGTDLAAAMALAGQRINLRKARRPLVLVLTDGMLPLGAGPGPVGKLFADSLGDPKLRPDVVFVVDEPMLTRTGLTPEHPVAALAAGLGARITLTTLAHLAGDESAVNLLLTAPGVLTDLDVELPQKAVLEDSLPTGLVAGNAVVLDGQYSGSAPNVQVRGRLAGKRETLSPKPTRMPAPPAALVASVRPTGADRPASDGFAVPPWYSRKYQRTARLGITWANRGGGDDPGRLDERIVRRYLGTRVFPRARACYNYALTRDQTIGGRVIFEFEVGKGEVMRASFDPSGMNNHDMVFERCLLEAAWMLDIPAGRLDDQIYRVRYPLVFNPPKTGRPAMSEDPLGPGTVELLLQHGLSGTPRPPRPE